MKELSIEEKAKAYDVALENAKHYHSEMGSDVCCVLEECFSELKESQESEEEMMAKAVDGYVIEDIEEGNGDFLLSADYLPKSMGLKDRQKVKVIVIKED